MSAPRNAVLLGDVVERLRELPDNSVDAIVTDPPYGINFMGKSWDGPDIAAKAQADRSKRHDLPASGRDGFGQRITERDWSAFSSPSAVAGSYDLSAKGNSAFQAWCTEWGRECLRVLKPGGHLVASGSTRTYHRLVAGLEDAGLEVRDTLCWLFGSGFPKSKNVGGGFGTALKPGFEPIVLARKPLAGTVSDTFYNHGTGVLNIKGCRISFASEADERESKDKNQHADFGSKVGTNNVYGDYSMVPAHNYDAPGRWPANVILDPEAAAALDEQSGVRAASNHPARRAGLGSERTLPSTSKGTTGERRGTGTGGASRFYYCAKASAKDREAGLPAGDGRQNTHPTVKPHDLMRWLVRLVGGARGSLILDPFAGSGSTLRAARAEGFDFLGIERDPDYHRIACLRAGLSDPAAEAA